MANVRLKCVGPAEISTLEDIAGVYSGGAHALPRYHRDPFDFRSPRMPGRRILNRRNAKLLAGSSDQTEFAGPPALRYFTDYWPGRSHLGYIVLGETRADILPNASARLAVVRHEIEASTEDDVDAFDEIVVQGKTADGWKTVASVINTNSSGFQRGIVDPEILPADSIITEAGFFQAVDGFLNTVVDKALGKPGGLQS